MDALDPATAAAEEAEQREDENHDQDDPEDAHDVLLFRSGVVSVKTPITAARIRPRRRDTEGRLAETANVRLLDLLAAMARDLVERLDADACAVSRAIGDVLVLVVEHAPPGRTLAMGQGYLTPDFPLTQEVMTSGRARALTLADDEVDAAEAAVLEELGFRSLVMLPLMIGTSGTWGLVEVYRTEPRPFGTRDLDTAAGILARVAARAG